MIAPPDAPRLSSAFLSRAGWSRGTHQIARLQRDGWTCVARPEGRDSPWVHVLERPVPGGWTLIRTVHLRHEAFELRPPRAGQALPLPGWGWADLDPDRERLVWAEEGCLWAAGVDATGLVRRTLLIDLNGMLPRRTPAPR
jgi:hypothetical protein